LAGTSGTPSTSNKYVTNDDTATAATASKVARRLAGGNITVVTETQGNNSTNAASTAYVDVAISNINSALPEQSIAYVANSTTANASTWFFQSNILGTVGVGVFTTSGTTANIFRFEKSNATSQWVITHTTTLVGGANLVDQKIAITSSYIYFMYTESSTNKMQRYDIADLANVTAMTLAGTSWGTSGTGTRAFSDGTIVYVGLQSTSGDVIPYTISGTTATGGSAITYTSSGYATGIACDGTYVYTTSVTNAASVDIRKYALAGGSATATDTYIITKGAYPNTNSGYNLFMQNSEVIGISFGYTIESNTAVTGSAMKIVSIPVL